MAFQFKAAPSWRPTWAAVNRTEIIEVKIAVKPAEVELIDECLHDNTARCLDLRYTVLATHVKLWVVFRGVRSAEVLYLS